MSVSRVQGVQSTQCVPVVGVALDGHAQALLWVAAALTRSKPNLSHDGAGALWKG